MTVPVSPTTADAPAASTGPGPRDGSARQRIVDALDETLFVEAGAGSGKTRALVDRVVALVGSGAARLAEIVVLTFTDKAAAELRDRIRHELSQAHARALAVGHHQPGARYAAALDELDGAAVGTLHSFAQRILREHPLEAGLPPRIEVLGEVASTVAFEERWTAFVDRLLDRADVERALLLASAAGVRLTALRAIAQAFNDSWDLAVDRAPRTPIEPPAWTDGLEQLLDELDDLCEQRHRCLQPDDRLHGLLDELAQWSGRLRASHDEHTRLWLLGREGGRPRFKANGRGTKENWVDDHDLQSLRDRVDDVMERCEALRNDVATAAVERLAVDLRRFTLDAASERRAAGQLEFHDLLVLARRMLRDPVCGPTVRRRLHRRYRRILIDELQDTDPIQIELAVLIGSPDDDAGSMRWDDVDPDPGRLFFVGDPKQSIYRFRRADISLFLRAAERFGADGRRLSLTTNHRTTAPIIDVVNRLFGTLIQPASRGGLPSQPAYEPLVPVRAGAPAGPPVCVLGRDPHDDTPRAAELRNREAADVAATIGRILREGWRVDGSPDWRRPAWQQASAGDITVLIPTRTNLAALEDALDDAGIAYRADAATLVYASRLVRDLFLTLRAIDDPSDELSTVAALRSPLFACGDDDLFRFRRVHGGRFDHGHALPAGLPADDVVAQALAYLRRLHEDRQWLTPSELIDRVVRDRRVLELGHVAGRARDLWRRVRFVTDQARAWSETTRGGLRQYLAWVRQQTADGARATEAVLPETDDDAVRIMTVHAAKGLQFPITIVAGLSTRPQRRRAEAEVAWPPDGPCALAVGTRVRSEAFDAWQPLDEQMSHDERIRLLYVACTRARDHLVVSLHRSRRKSAPPDPAKLSSAELLADAAGELLAELPDGAAPGEPSRLAHAGTTDPEAAAANAAPAGSPAALPPFDKWRRTRAAALAASGRPRTLAATTLRPADDPAGADDPGLRKHGRDLDLPPWSKGRYGTAVGRAVHGVLQTVDLASGAGLADVVAAQAAAESVTGTEDRIHALAEAALRAPTVRAAASGPHWRELYVAVPVADDLVLEGYVDLVYRRPDGLVVVDYKTGPEDLHADLDPLVARYTPQGAAYALAVGAATGEPVAAVVFVFLTPEGAVERPVVDLATAVAQVRDAAAAGRLPGAGPDAGR